MAKVGRLVYALILTSFIGANMLFAAPLNIGINYQVRPYIIGTDSGIELDIVSTILKRLELPHHYHAFSLNRARRSLAFAKMDISLTSIYNKGSAQCSDPYVYYSNVAISLKSSNITLNQISDLAPVSIYSWQGANKVLGPDFFRMYPTVGSGYKEISRVERLPLLLYKGRSDVIIIDKFIFSYLWREFALYFKALPQVTFHPIFDRRVYYCAKIKDPILRRLFNIELNKLKHNGELQAIYKKYIPLATPDDLSWD